MKIIYELNNMLNIVIPVDQSINIDELANQVVPKGISYNIINDDKVPNNRTFREAWKKDTTGGVMVDMARAKIIHMNNIRELRNKKLAELDVVQQILSDQGKDTSTLLAEKQALRDLPATFSLDSATTPEELEMLYPSELS